jgi:putative N6-adenine-specific DNA methylase
MNLLIMCPPGFENEMQEEANELIQKKATLHTGMIIVDECSYADAATLCFHSQLAQRVLIHLGVQDNTTEEINESIFNEYLVSGTSYGVKATKQEEALMQSTDIAAEVGYTIGEYAKEKNIDLSVNLKQPDVLIHATVTESKTYFGIDLVGFDMSKRPYKVVNTSHSLNGAFVYGILRKIKYQEQDMILDPFCHTGIFCIEAALRNTKRSIFFYEHEFQGFLYKQTKKEFEQVQGQLDNTQESNQKIIGYDSMLKTIKAAEKNAKIAGIHNDIQLSKVGIDWIDSKFDEFSVPFIISYPPQISKRAANQKDILKLYDELFYQAKYILQKEGLMYLLMHKPLDEELLLRHEFAIKEQVDLHSGGQPFILYTIEREKK